MFLIEVTGAEEKAGGPQSEKVADACWYELKPLHYVFYLEEYTTPKALQV